MALDQRAEWDALTIRRPGDVPIPTPLSWQIAKHTEHADRLMNNLLPDNFPYDVQRGDAGDALAVLALRESIRRDVEQGRGNRVHEAMLLGATWTEVAAALDVDTEQARAVLRAYANGQRNLYQRSVDEGAERPLGFSPDKYAAVMALTELDDTTAAAGEAVKAAE
ncbi:hypothetical protein [Streptomyces sp. NPDC002078]